MQTVDENTPIVKAPEELEKYAAFLGEGLPEFLRFIGRNEQIKGEIDAKSAAYGKAYAAQIDCTACANCCRKLEPELHGEELSKLAIHAGESLSKFIDNELVRLSEQDSFYMKAKPCRFLAGNCCSIYADRPQSCRSFPRFDIPNFRFRLSLRQYASICPIVASVLISLANYYEYTVPVRDGDSPARV